MNVTERDLIERLFQKINQTAAQAGPRDPQAEQLINQQMQRIPGAAYYMAQTIVAQRQAMKQAEAQIADLESRLGLQPGSPQSFLGQGPQYAPGYDGPGYPPAYGYQQPYYGGGGFGGGGFGGGGFLAGAAQAALGIAGGVVLANVAMSLFDGIGAGVGDLFNDASNAMDNFGNSFDYQNADPGSFSGADQTAMADFDPGSAGVGDGGVFGGGGDLGGEEW
jgi:hypothetical protein